MIGLTEVIKSISSLLKANTNLPVHSRSTQEGFKKSCFFIEVANDASGMLASDIYGDSIAIRITYFALDEKQIKNIFTMRDVLRDLFSQGFAVNDEFYINLTEDITFTITRDNNLECLLEFSMAQLMPAETGEDIEELVTNI